MVHVETVDLAQRNVVFPTDRVGMVLAQPYLLLTGAEPYQCSAQARAAQLQVLTETFAVARAAPHGASKTHFTIFPEYSIPGADGIALVEATLRANEWPTGTVVIGGTDGLSRADFQTLATTPNTHLNAIHNGLARVAQHQWINCGITWVKGADGTVERWLQPKLFPAWPEQNVHCHDMFRGGSVFMFKGPHDNGTHYRFCSLVCFDWIATVGTQKTWRWVLEDLRQQAAQAQAELSLSWLFVIQNNERPSHDAFLSEVGSFFDQTTLPNVRRERACLVFVNSAGKAAPGRADSHGNTSLVFSRQTLFAEPECRPTFSNGGKRFRSSTLLSAHRDVLFRERGACIHSFLQVNPNSLNAGAAGRAIAVENAWVFPLAGVNDPRVPAAAVPACVKWLNDELDSVPSLSRFYPQASLVADADSAHQRTVTGLRTLSARSTLAAVTMAARESDAKHADAWAQVESEALEHVVHTLDIVGLGFATSKTDADLAHATVLMNAQQIDLLAIRGSSHERCIEHSKRFLTRPRRQVLLVSRDRDNTPWRERFGSFLQPVTSTLGQERKITDPASGSLHLGYEKLLEVFRQSATVADIQGAINAELAA